MILRLLLAFLFVFPVACGRTEMVKEEKCFRIVGEKSYMFQNALGLQSYFILEDGREVQPYDHKGVGNKGKLDAFGRYCETIYREKK